MQNAAVVFTQRPARPEVSEPCSLPSVPVPVGRRGSSVTRLAALKPGPYYHRLRLLPLLQRQCWPNEFRGPVAGASAPGGSRAAVSHSARTSPGWRHCQVSLGAACPGPPRRRPAALHPRPAGGTEVAGHHASPCGRFRRRVAASSSRTRVESACCPPSPPEVTGSDLREPVPHCNVALQQR